MTWTFDDAYASHLNVIAPMFAELGVDVTFFPTCTAIVFDPEGWQSAMELGHEVANHTMTHVAAGPDVDVDEIAGCDTVIEVVLGVESATFAYPDGTIDEPYSTYSRENHLAARGTDLPFAMLESGGMYDWHALQAFGLGGAPTIGPGGEVLTAELAVDAAAAGSGWLTLIVHAVDEPGFASISLAEIEQLLATIGEHDLWHASFVDVATHLRMREAFRRLQSELSDGGWRFTWIPVEGMSDLPIRLEVSHGSVHQNGAPVPVEDGFALIDARVGAFDWFEG